MDYLLPIKGWLQFTMQVEDQVKITELVGIGEKFLQLYPKMVFSCEVLSTNTQLNVPESDVL